jgi:hypothetical protein
MAQIRVLIANSMKRTDLLDGASEALPANLGQLTPAGPTVLRKSASK